MYYLTPPPPQHFDQSCTTSPPPPNILISHVLPLSPPNILISHVLPNSPPPNILISHVLPNSPPPKKIISHVLPNSPPPLPKFWSQSCTTNSLSPPPPLCLSQSLVWTCCGLSTSVMQLDHSHLKRIISLPRQSGRIELGLPGHRPAEMSVHASMLWCMQVKWISVDLNPWHPIWPFKRD